MEPMLFLLKSVLAPIIGVVVTLIVSEPIKNRLAPLVSRFGSKKEEGVSGLWKATFYYGKPEKPYVQVIEISTLFGSIVGRIIPHELNEDAAKRTEKNAPYVLEEQ
jgi:hypothetical protein